MEFQWCKARRGLRALMRTPVSIGLSYVWGRTGGRYVGPYQTIHQTRHTSGLMTRRFGHFGGGVLSDMH